MHADDPKVVGGDGSSFSKAIVLKNWFSWRSIGEMEELLVRGKVQSGSLKVPETVIRDGRTYHVLRFTNRNSSQQEVVYFDVTNAIGKQP